MKQNQIAQEHENQEILSWCTICLVEINKLDSWNDKQVPKPLPPKTIKMNTLDSFFKISSSKPQVTVQVVSDIFEDTSCWLCWKNVCKNCL